MEKNWKMLAQKISKNGQTIFTNTIYMKKKNQKNKKNKL